MKDILVAFGRAGRSLGRRDIFWHLLWPGLIALVIWAGVAFYAWTPVTEWIYAAVSGWSFVGGWLSASETTAAIVLVLIQIATALLVVPLVYVTAAMLVATRLRSSSMMTTSADSLAAVAPLAPPAAAAPGPAARRVVRGPERAFLRRLRRQPRGGRRRHRRVPEKRYALGVGPVVRSSVALRPPSRWWRGPSWPIRPE